MKLNLRDPLFWVMHGVAAAALSVALYVSPVNAQMASGFGGGWVPKSGGTFTGPVTNTGQPSFLAFVSAATVLNLTGNGAAATVVFDSEVFDQANNYNPATGIFTATTDGKYQFNATIDFTGNTATGFLARLVTSNRTYRGFFYRPANVCAAGGDCQMSFSFLADMESGDTASVQIVGSGLAGDTAGVYGGSSPQFTVFSGFLAN